MSWLTRDQIKNEVVKPALKRVADFDESGNWESFDFSNFHDFHKKAFINEVSFLMNMQSFDIFLSNDDLEGRTLSQFIDHVNKNQSKALKQEKVVL